MLHVCIVVTCLIGIIDNLVSPDQGSLGKSSLMAAIFVLNIAFLVLWMFVAVQMLIKFSKESPKLAILLLICSCGWINLNKGAKNKEGEPASWDGKQAETKSIKDLEN